MTTIARFFVLMSILISLSLPATADEVGDAKRAYGAGDFAEAAGLLRPLARKENVEALYLLGRMYEQGDGVAKDLKEAKRLYSQAAKKGHEDAAQRIALFENADSGEESVVLEWYLPAAEEGDMEAQYNLGFMYETGWGVRIDEEKAARWYQEASDQQHDMAQLRLGMMYIVGKGVRQDQDTGVELLRLSAENGNRVAEVLVQEVFDIGDAERLNAEKLVGGLRRVVDEGEQQALRILNASLDKARARARRGEQSPRVSKTTSEDKSGNSSALPLPKSDSLSSAQFNIAKALDKAGNVPQNEAEMVKWYITSARQGNADAQFNLGILYMQGRGVSHDTQEGLRWFNAAASQGHELSKDYLQLWNNELDNATLGGSIAVTWLKENARNWELDSLYMLGQMFESGRGVNQNLNEAKIWYRLAAEGGHQEARRRLDLINQGKATIVPSTSTAVSASEGSEKQQDTTITTGKAVASQFDWFWMILGVAGIVGLGFVVFLLFRRSGGHMPSFQMPRTHHAGSAANVASDDVEFLKGLWDDNIEPQEPARVEPVKPKSSPRPAAAGGEAAGATEVFKAVTWGPGDKKKPIISEDDIPLPDIKAILSKEEVLDEPEESKVSAPREIEPPPVSESKRSTGVEPVKVKARKPEPRRPEPPKAEPMIEPVEAVEPKPLYGAKNAWSLSDSQVVSADDLSGSGISRDALASGRVKADSLFEDGLSIDREGKAAPRKPVEPKPRVVEAEAPEPSGPIDFADLDLQSIRKNGKSERSPVINIKAEGPVSNAPEDAPQKSVEKISPPSQAARISANSFESVPSKPEKPATVPASPVEEESRSLAEVHFNIGVMFAAGDGVPRNDVMAAKWFRKSADEGLAEAQFRLGELYLSGAGVEKDPEKGMQWIRKAAEMGYREAVEFLSKRNQA